VARIAVPDTHHGVLGGSVCEKLEDLLKAVREEEERS
jgi:hypothetical protein